MPDETGRAEAAALAQFGRTEGRLGTLVVEKWLGACESTACFFHRPCLLAHTKMQYERAEAEDAGPDGEPRAV